MMPRNQLLVKFQCLLYDGYSRTGSIWLLMFLLIKITNTSYHPINEVYFRPYIAILDTDAPCAITSEYDFVLVEVYQMKI